MMNLSVVRRCPALNVCWSSVLVFTVLLNIGTSSIDSSTRTRTSDNINSANERLQKLRKIADRLKENIRRDYKTDGNSYHSPQADNSEYEIMTSQFIEDLAENREPLNWWSSGGLARGEVHKRYGRDSAGSSQTFKLSYLEFHEKLVSFVNDLATKLKPTAPAVLQNIQLIPLLLTPANMGLEISNVALRFGFTYEATELVLDNIAIYFKPDQLQWLQTAILELTYLMKAASLALGALVMDNTIQISLLAGGLSSVNQAVRSYNMDATTLTKIYEVDKFLNGTTS